MEYTDNTVNKLISNARKGKRKFDSLYPIYGFFGTVQELMKNFFLFEEVCRLDKLLATQEKPVKPAIPINIEVYGKGHDLENWPEKERILEIRGEFGLEQFSTRLERGDLCFTAYSNGKFVGFTWLELPSVTEAGYPLLQDEAFIFDAWTFVDFRGKRVSPFLQQAIKNYVRKNRPDIRTLVTHIATWNKASLSGFQWAGYKIIRQESKIVIFGFHKVIPLNKQIPADLIMQQDK